MENKHLEQWSWWFLSSLHLVNCHIISKKDKKHRWLRHTQTERFRGSTKYTRSNGIKLNSSESSNSSGSGNFFYKKKLMWRWHFWNDDKILIDNFMLTKIALGAYFPSWVFFELLKVQLSEKIAYMKKSTISYRLLM